MKLFNFLMRLYPAAFRAEFEDEMRTVFLERYVEQPAKEIMGLLRGALYERGRLIEPAPIAAGAASAFAIHFLIYALLLTPAAAQPKQDPTAMDTAKSIYTRAFTLTRDAKNMDDMRRLSDSLDAPEWVSIDRFGRQLLNRKQAEREFESILALPPEQRAAAMDIIWAERDETRLIVVAWMFPQETTRDGHKLSRATLIRDIFDSTPAGWRRIRHEKFLPNGTVLAIDGNPLAEGNRVTPAAVK